MIIKKQLIKRDIAGDIILVPVGKTIYESSGLFTLNEVGAFIWDLLAEAESEEDILSAVLQEYDVTETQARADIGEFLSALRSMGVL